MLNWILAAMAFVAWSGAFGWYFAPDIRAWLRTQYWWNRLPIWQWSWWRPAWNRLSGRRRPGPEIADGTQDTEPG